MLDYMLEQGRAHAHAMTTRPVPDMQAFELTDLGREVFQSQTAQRPVRVHGQPVADPCQIGRLGVQCVPAPTWRMRCAKGGMSGDQG